MIPLDEELIQPSQTAPGTQQADLVRRFCMTAEEQLAAASSLAEARLIAREACERFSSECASPVLVRRLQALLEDRITALWHNRHDHR